MKVLFIGGTGNISTSVSELLIEKGVDLYHLNRGMRQPIQGVAHLKADITDMTGVKKVLDGHHWDVVVNWIAYEPADVQRDIALFEHTADQYIFISSASAYQKQHDHQLITESTPLENPWWDYSRKKIACEQLLMNAFRDQGFPVTIVRPSHTYCSVIPLALGGSKEYTGIDRMKKGLPMVVHGDGNTLWTLTHSADFAKGFVGLTGNSQAIGEAFHITSDEALTWNQIFTTVAHAAGCEPNIVHIASEYISAYADKTHYKSVQGTLLGDKAHNAVFDNTKLKSLVPDYQATIPFAAGIRKTLDWFEADPTRMIINEDTNRFLDGLVASGSAFSIR